MVSDQPSPQQLEQAPPIDPGHQFLAPGPSQMWLTPVKRPTDGADVLLLTIRTPTTTLTIDLTREAALDWSSLLERAAQQMSGLLVPSLIRP